METKTTSGIIQTTFPKLDVIHNINGMAGTMALASLTKTVEIYCLMPMADSINKERAEELKKRWNLHPELVDVLQIINEQIEHAGTITISKTSVIDTAIKMVLKEAEK